MIPWARAWDVSKAVESARRVYSRYDFTERLEHDSPETYNQFRPSMQDRVAKWLDKQRQE